MSNRKALFKRILNQAAIGASGVYSEVVDISNLNIVCVQAIWANGVGHTGDFQVEVSLDGVNYFPLRLVLAVQLGSNVVAIGAAASGNFAWVLQDLAFKYLRATWNRTAGVADIQIYIGCAGQG